MDDELIYLVGADNQHAPRGEWLIFDYDGRDAPCRYGIVAPEGGVVFWTYWEHEARRLVHGMRLAELAR